jgi:tetrahydromethanopterin S-methyltransferase subunit G
MGAIDDTRKVLQDFLAPEIREIKARLDALETRMNERFDAVERLAHQRHDAVMAGINSLANYNEVKERLTKLEAAKEAVHQ